MGKNRDFRNRKKDREWPTDEERRSKKAKLDTSAEGGETEGGENKNKAAKRKVAMLFGYVGTDYVGLQINPSVKTVEGELYKAMIASGIISQDNADDMKKVNWIRASRTDKGVHAANNVVSFKMLCIDDALEIVNKNLPEDIRIFAFKRVTGSFNGKNHNSGRKYEYVVPTFMFKKVELEENQALGDDEIDKTYKIDAETKQKVDRALEKFVGTRNYHNYTARSRFAKPTDACCRRYITEFKSGEVFEMEGIEFMSIYVHGQSFMFNQIRKMIGMVIGVVQGLIPEDILERSLTPDLDVVVPLAPGAGLILNELDYSAYNKKFGSVHGELKWDDLKDEVANFKKVIYAAVSKEEKENNVCAAWLCEVFANRAKYGPKDKDSKNVVEEAEEETGENDE